MEFATALYNPQKSLAVQASMVYDIVGSHSHIESAKIWHKF